jgi:hypothetical protein
VFLQLAIALCIVMMCTCEYELVEFASQWKGDRSLAVFFVLTSACTVLLSSLHSWPMLQGVLDGSTHEMLLGSCALHFDFAIASVSVMVTALQRG